MYVCTDGEYGMPRGDVMSKDSLRVCGPKGIKKCGGGGTIFYWKQLRTGSRKYIALVATKSLGTHHPPMLNKCHACLAHSPRPWLILLYLNLHLAMRQ
jgi:hypothetical protein